MSLQKKTCCGAVPKAAMLAVFRGFFCLRWVLGTEAYSDQKVQQPVDTNAEDAQKAALAAATEEIMDTSGSLNKTVSGLALPADVGAKGLLLLFHGCTHQAGDWTFLPEEQKFLKVAQKEFQLGYLAFETPLGDMANWCWPSDPNGVKTVADDVRAELALLKQKRPEYKQLIADKKVYCVGGSSGGNVIGLLGAEYPDLCTGGFAFYVSPGGLSDEKIASSAHLKERPVVWVYMGKDSSFASLPRISRAKEAWCGKGDSDKDSLCKVMNIEPRPLSADEFVAISAEKGAKWFSELQDMEYLKPDGHAKRDPRSDPGWAGRFFSRPALKNQEKMRAKMAIEELLNRAWASHEFAGDQAREVLTHLVTPPPHPGGATDREEESNTSDGTL
ncbi:unnamed protein product [Amoebophrya sp. A25]|nr:unnamed protein product [Amoebophrya sp. A25]|eukprot:GSA25T00025294001.1